MRKNIIFGASAVMMFAVISCGGSEESTESTENTDSVVVIEPVTYTIDTAASIINWYNMDGDAKGHFGTVKVLEGTYTLEGDVITAGSLTANLNSVSVDDEMGGAKLLGHILTADLLDVNQFATATFTFEKHENSSVVGTLSVSGVDVVIDAPVSINEGGLEVADFTANLAHLPFFIREVAEVANEAERHDPNIGFNASIVAVK